MDKVSILQIAIPLIKQFEGFKSKPYPDQGGIPTIGYGTTYYLDGRHVSLSDSSIDEQTATNLLINKIQQEFLPALERIFSGSSSINSNQYAALLSFEYNEGKGALAGSTLAKKLIAGDVSGASDEFLKWDVVGGQTIQGLLNRRLKEQSLFNTPV